MWMSKGARWSAIMLGLQVASCMSIELSVRSAGHMQQQPMRLKGGSSYFSKEGGGSGVTRNATKPSAPAGWTSGKGQAPQPKGQGGGTKAAQADVASKAGQKQEEEAAAPPPPAMKPVIPRMSQTVTRMESYSMLDEDKITSKLRDEAEVAPSAHPIPLPTGKTKAQPKPEPPKEVTDAWLRVLDQAVGGKTVLKAERPEEVIQEVSRISAAAKAEQVAAKAAETAEVAEEQEQPEEDGRQA
ncbi:hypothetical protein GUITHDRAFT_110519 [Guillardia theta CCMP2712]|uniref:Uncharacterized protein n=1 Tax=Guillardia theta (strain CCMP2712) TaxID=905079 RepID=L1J505_GUITC|nr:hypothetical protein GUITHDRAFT_110519 [Guillardia theta CCMP2712]EKX43397.1 hypothetical protein GUITHDRAFT_110519 [Guillardia theta CCMP2712]|eukprot:XP_005830377.1 hypothetical protein GUITHDRAFT_110519 [Guillardia theta CCMP2712]